MDNIEKLKYAGIISNVRLAFGAKNINDESLDDKINNLNHSQLLNLYCTHKYGNGQIWVDCKNIFDSFEEMEIIYNKI